MIEIERSGLILHVERYEACVEFYRDKLGLPVELEKNEPGQVLTLMTCGGAYLMVEPGGVARDAAKATVENPVTIRFNVADVDSAADGLRRQGIDIAVSKIFMGRHRRFLRP